MIKFFVLYVLLFPITVPLLIIKWLFVYGGKILKFFLVYVLLGPITIPLYLITWVFKGK
ncbi:hypothetical protein SIN01_28410 [Sporolactobacillus inulinus]|nr:hypothetical protein SIN01_28410 [Sporolactobacillus inulinus]